MGVVGYQGSKLKSRGLGDTIATVAHVTGISAIVDKVSKVTGKDCGCKKRKKKLNKAFPYKEKAQKTR
jgi:hypothetical protein